MNNTINTKEILGGNNNNRTYRFIGSTYNTQSVRMYHGSITIVTDKDLDLKEMFSQYKRVKIDEEVIYLDLNAQMPYKIHTCDIYLDSSDFSNYVIVRDPRTGQAFQSIEPPEITEEKINLKESDIMTLNLATAGIDDIIKHGKSLKFLSIFNLLTYIGVDIKELPFNYDNLKQMLELDNHLVKKRFDTINADIYEIFQRFYVVNCNEYLPTIKFSNVVKYSPYPIIVAIDNSEYDIIHKFDAEKSNYRIIKHFLDIDKLFSNLIQNSNKEPLGSKSYDIITHLCEDIDIKETTYKYLDKVNRKMLNAMLPDLLRNKYSYMNLNPISRKKLLANNNRDVKNILEGYLRCVPRGFEKGKEDFIGIIKSDLFHKLSGGSKGIYHTINNEDSIIKQDTFANTLKIISLYDDGYEKSSLLMILTKLYIQIIINCDGDKVQYLNEVFHLMEYIFKNEDLLEFIGYFVFELEQKDSEKYAHIINRMNDSVKLVNDIGILSTTLYKEIEKTRQYKRFKLEQSLKK